MKKHLIVIILIISAAFFYYGVTAAMSWYGVESKTEDTDDGNKLSMCPITKIKDNNKCMNCHILRTKDGEPRFGLKEIDPTNGYSPPGKTKIIVSNGELVPYLEINGTDSLQFQLLHDYLLWHPEFRRVIVEMFSPGGSVVDAWRSVGYIKKMQNKGIIVETHCYGFAASAGAIILIAGDIGHRYVSPHAEIMLHKVWTFKMFSIESPDTAEDQADILKHFQKNINDFILSRTKITKECLNASMFKKDFWLTGEESVNVYGIADKLI